MRRMNTGTLWKKNESQNNTDGNSLRLGVVSFSGLN